MIDKCEMLLKQSEVKGNCSRHGIHSKDYETSSNELDDMQAQYEAQKFKNRRGSRPHTKTSNIK